MDLKAFSYRWRGTYFKSAPLGYVLRYDFRLRWTRFHALPESKRYATTDEERSIILERANTLGSECFEEGEQILVVTAVHPGFKKEDNELAVRMDMTEVMTWIDEEQEPEDQAEIKFYASFAEWTPNGFDQLFGEIAEDERRAIFLSHNWKTILAPYDGGFDVIALKPGRIDELEEKFRAWMSDRPDKL